MSTISKVPGSIEGKQILLTGLKIIPQGRPLITRQREVVFPVSVDCRGAGLISKEFSPLVHKIKSNSNLKAGSKISGRQIWGFCSQPITKSDVKKGGHGKSGRHSGQELIMVDNCFAELIFGWRGNALLVHPKNELFNGI